MANPCTLIFSCLLFASLFSAFNARQVEVLDESHFAYAKGKNGPKNWAHVDPKWKLCQSGKFQSPIDLRDARVEVTPSLGELRKTYKPAPAVIINRGHDIMVQWNGDAGAVIVNGSEYKLQQAHWHTPSEHTIEGRKFDMELHMVHNNSAGQVAVIGILYEIGRSDSFLGKFLDTIKKAKAGTNVGVVSPKSIRFGNRKYFRYMGSMTVPPCTEGVLWTVLKKIRTVSREQIKTLRAAVHDGFENNARPTQSLKGRTELLYRPTA